MLIVGGVYLLQALRRRIARHQKKCKTNSVVLIIQHARVQVSVVHARAQ